jgi:lysozyme
VRAAAQGAAERARRLDQPGLQHRPAGFCGSTAARRFRAGDVRGGCDAFLAWNKAGGRVVAGLAKPAPAERQICLRDAA